MTVDKLLLKHAASTPDAMAIATPSRSYTYRQLVDATERYASVLHDAGLARGDRLMAVLEPGFEAVVLFCACARLGLILVPGSPETPLPRLHAMADAVGAVAIVAAPASPLPAQLRSPGSPVRCGSVDEEALHWSEPLASVAIGAPADVIDIDPIYVVFTSGSTGRPKGIVMTHRGVCAFFQALVDFTALAPGSIVGTIAPIQFDFCWLDVGLALVSGCTIAFIPRASFFQPREMVRHMKALGVTQMNGVPSLWTSILRYAPQHLASLDRLHSILFAGEPFPLTDLRRLQAQFPHLRVINCFGQSESIACSFADVPNPLPPDVERLSFGRGHAGVDLMNIDENGRRITTPFTTGELYLRAGSLFIGYWGDRADSERALVLNPLNPESGEKVFKTGDLVYFDDRGDFYFVGRADNQIKIMGNRVELGDVAATLRTMPHVADAVVVTAASEATVTLLAWIVPEPGMSLTAESVRAFCLTALPRHMLPGHVEIVDALPINANGKVDIQWIRNEWLKTHA